MSLGITSGQEGEKLRILQCSRDQQTRTILAINWHNVASSEVIRGSVNMDKLSGFLTSTMSILGEGEEFIFVMDYVNFHHSVTVPESSNFSREFLPAYSSMLNLYEVFALIKSNVRQSSPLLDIQDQISSKKDASCSMIPQHLENFIIHAESFYRTCLNLEDVGGVII
ncbi:hypothetical protein RF11_09269 [Thelohanellus kitauei]|uniref:Tc1-like transposase DDE domain-containing protein n=1 Tax=Thelohanellus kitauei TaxID=669202 RepID=A0A0C2IHQ3_THEKT|nr:hypothetical protein RF11_09269 [Thelohanellus kitauei]